MLLGEVLKLADHSLPNMVSGSIQPLNELFSDAVSEIGTGSDDGLPTAMIYQVERVSRTMHKSSVTPQGQFNATNAMSTGRRRDRDGSFSTENTKPTKMSVDMDDATFRNTLIETQVLHTSNYVKWRWDLIQDLIEGPLTNPKRLEESIKTSKFMKNLVGFYRPFKYRFVEVRNTKPNQRYVRAGCSLMKTLIQHQEGVNYLVESKFLRQLAECLAQLDKQSGLTAMKPLFSRERLSDTLAGGYFAMIGTLSGDPKGLTILERWHMINMLYHILDLENREDLVKSLLSSLDFSLDSHTRVMLSKSLTACSKNVRIFATRLLRKYALFPPTEINELARQPEGCQWAIRLLVTQLYDPEVQVSEIAVQILEEVCNKMANLEYVVRCRPALDHLGAIGAPLLLRFVSKPHAPQLIASADKHSFLSTSLGYQYLHGLDYITQEMDDWFLVCSAFETTDIKH